jgi:hypothetical protein
MVSPTSRGFLSSNTSIEFKVDAVKDVGLEGVVFDGVEEEEPPELLLLSGLGAVESVAVEVVDGFTAWSDVWSGGGARGGGCGKVETCAKVAVRDAIQIPTRLTKAIFFILELILECGGYHVLVKTVETNIGILKRILIVKIDCSVGGENVVKS